MLPPTLKPTRTARSSPSARRTWSGVEAEADDPELLALVGRAAVAAQVEDDRAVARREPLRDLAPVERARARAAVQEHERDARCRARVTAIRPPGTGTFSAPGTIRAIDRSTNHSVDSARSAPVAGERAAAAFGRLHPRDGGLAVPDDEPGHRQQASHPRGGRRDDRRTASTIAIGGLSMNSVPMAFVRDARPPQGARPDRRRDRARHADRVARRGRLRSLGRLRARQPRGLRARAALPGRRPGGRGRDRGVQRAHPDLPPPGRGLPDPLHADEGGPRHRHARPPSGDDPRASRIPPPASAYVACTPLPVDVAIVHARGRRHARQRAGRPEARLDGLRARRRLPRRRS